MPTKAGRLRIEDIRVGRIIYDIAIDWVTYSAYARPLKITTKHLHGFNQGRDVFFSTLEPEGHTHYFHTRRDVTQCGFFGTVDQGKTNTQVINEIVAPQNFFVSKRAAERYMARMRLDGTWAYDRPAQYEALGMVPHRERELRMAWRAKRIGQLPENIGPAAIKEVEAIWGKIQREHPDSPLTKLSNAELVASVNRFVASLMDSAHKASDLIIEHWKQLPNGSVEFSISGPPDVVARMRAAQEQTLSAYSIGVAKDGIEPPPAGEGSMSDQTGQPGERAVVDVKADPNSAV